MATQRQVFTYVGLWVVSLFYILIRVLGFGFFGAEKWPALVPAALWLLLAIMPARVIGYITVSLPLFLTMLLFQVLGGGFDTFAQSAVETIMFGGLLLLKAFVARPSTSS
ncbi:hypothetical protein MUU77_06315 [Pseudoxanthomonas sp. F37]|uniref:hypothetical protein n=1 Tax=Pseudoxanthomonas TaxID=83618 RepID=UPI001FD3EE3A|nr:MULTISPECIES: hypothetical protein [Pseudoxanthomonas]UOV04891.1 hypothetical protein MUU75_17720 [Pseudoxanthomonas mexicana]UOV09898.1 hypothetical protein MUU77_06315 [Pseudoxanthomonas sp. F37]